jgi:hypothetical protein
LRGCRIDAHLRAARRLSGRTPCPDVLDGFPSFLDLPQHPAKDRIDTNTTSGEYVREMSAVSRPKVSRPGVSRSRQVLILTEPPPNNF